MKHITRTLFFTVFIVALMLNTAFAGEVVYSERCMKIKQAEHAIEEKYQLEPAMYTFFARTVEEHEDGSLTLTLSGDSDFYYVLGTYTATVSGEGATASWSNEGKNTDGGFAAEAWNYVQLKDMVRISIRDNGYYSYFPLATAVARQEDPDYYFHEDTGLYMLPEHPADPEIIAERGKMTPEAMGKSALEAVREIYALNEEQAALLTLNDMEPDFMYVEEGGKLIYQALLSLCQKDDGSGFPEWTEKDGQYIVFIDAETGIVEDLIYDTTLNGNG